MEILISYNQRLQGKLASIKDTGFDSTKVFSFNTGDLQYYTDEHSIKKCGIWEQFYKEFDTIASPLIYWFELGSDQVNNQKIFSTFLEYKSEKKRNVPAHRSNFSNWDTKTLYVGCCAKTRFVNRFFWHSGYYKVVRTQGLQLCHWAIPLKIPLKLHVVSIPYEVAEFTTLYEKQLATHLKPLLGKH